VGFAAAAGFFEAAAFPCPRDALERISSAPQQIKNEKIETATALRQRPGRMNFLFLSAPNSPKHTSEAYSAALGFSWLPQISSTVL
jgi:hypothetical protein